MKMQLQIEAKSQTSLGSWSDAQAYDHYIGRWSRVVARPFVDWLDADGGGRWADVGCGTGQLTRCIASRTEPVHIVGIDRSPAFLRGAGAAASGPLRLCVGEASALPLCSGSLDWAVSGLTLNFLSSPDAAIKEMARACKSRGRVALYVWDYPQMEITSRFWAAASQFDERAALLSSRQNRGCSGAELRALFMGRGMTGIETRTFSGVAWFESFSDYWTPFESGQGMNGRYLRSLAPEQRQRLKTILRQSTQQLDSPALRLRIRARGISGRLPRGKS